MRPSKRLERIPPYLFAELERKVAAKRAAGVDVISLGIGDPDRPTFAPIVEAARVAVADPGTHQYPSNRGRAEFRHAMAAFYARRFGVTLDPDTEVMATIGPRSASSTSTSRSSIPTTSPSPPIPAIPCTPPAPSSPGRRRPSCLWCPSAASSPISPPSTPGRSSRARLTVRQLPQQPNRRRRARRLLRAASSPSRAEHDILVVHDAAYTETTYDGYVAPSFLATPGAASRVEVFSLSKGFNMTGWRCAAIVGNAEAASVYWRLKTASVRASSRPCSSPDAALAPEVDRDVSGDERALHAATRLVCDALAADRVDVTAARRDDLRVGPGTRRVRRLRRLLRARARAGGGVVISPGGAYGPSGEGWFRISLTTPDDRLVEAVERLGRLA